jgi:hypothetical protein
LADGETHGFGLGLWDGHFDHWLSNWLNNWFNNWLNNWFLRESSFLLFWEVGLRLFLERDLGVGVVGFFVEISFFVALVVRGALVVAFLSALLAVFLVPSVVLPGVLVTLLLLIIVAGLGVALVAWIVVADGTVVLLGVLSGLLLLLLVVHLGLGHGLLVVGVVVVVDLLEDAFGVGFVLELGTWLHEGQLEEHVFEQVGWVSRDVVVHLLQQHDVGEHELEVLHHLVALHELLLVEGLVVGLGIAGVVCHQQIKYTQYSFITRFIIHLHPTQPKSPPFLCPTHSLRPTLSSSCLGLILSDHLAGGRYSFRSASIHS